MNPPERPSSRTARAHQDVGIALCHSVVVRGARCTGPDLHGRVRSSVLRRQHRVRKSVSQRRNDARSVGQRGSRDRVQRPREAARRAVWQRPLRLARVPGTGRAHARPRDRQPLAAFHLRIARHDSDPSRRARSGSRDPSRPAAAAPARDVDVQPRSGDGTAVAGLGTASHARCVDQLAAAEHRRTSRAVRCRLQRQRWSLRRSPSQWSVARRARGRTAVRQRSGERQPGVRARPGVDASRGTVRRRARLATPSPRAMSPIGSGRR